MDLADAAAVFVRAVMPPLALLLPLINPPGTIPIFLSMTAGASRASRRLLARRIAINAFALLVGAMAGGSYILMLFGLSIDVIKIAGGLLVMATAWRLLSADHSPDAELAAAATTVRVEQPAGHGFHPLTFPITIGPGSISVAMALGADARVREVADLPRMLGVLVGICVVSVSIYLCYRFGARLLGAFGPTGGVVVIRLSAFVLLSVGVQLLCDGISERFAAAAPAAATARPGQNR